MFPLFGHDRAGRLPFARQPSASAAFFMKAEISIFWGQCVSQLRQAMQSLAFPCCLISCS